MNCDTPNTLFPHQVSAEQAGLEKSEIAFSNGAYVSHEFEIHCASGTELTSNNRTTTSTRSTNAHRPSNPARHPDYADYGQRLRSYARWSLTQPDPVRLCEAGFFFTDQYDLVRCFQCGIGLKDFSDGDDPLLEHVRHFSNCPYLREYLGLEGLSAIKSKCQTNNSTNNNGQPQQFYNNKSSNLCRHPEYQTVEARLATFVGWPIHMFQTPLDLAAAGLYYTGSEDQVRCFMCDGGLKQWDSEDDPWTEHCRWFPDCPFAREIKGGDYIALVQASTEYIRGENEYITNVQQGPISRELTNGIEQMTLEDTDQSASLLEHKDTCLEMGYQLTDINDAVKQLREMGKTNPTIEEILDTIDACKERQQNVHSLEVNSYESPLEENQRLKRLIICMTCNRNNVNVLFLPCKHHHVCMECSKSLEKCPVCERVIREKIRTYLA